MCYSYTVLLSMSHAAEWLEAAVCCNMLKSGAHCVVPVMVDCAMVHAASGDVYTHTMMHCLINVLIN